MDPVQLLTVPAAFVLGGAVKGVVGLGLPTVALAVLGTALGPDEALPAASEPEELGVPLGEPHPSWMERTEAEWQRRYAKG